MSSRVLKRCSFVAALCVSVLAGALCFAAPSHALSNLGPDPNDFSGTDATPQDQFGYVVTSASYSQIQVTQTRVNVYFTNNSGNKTVTIIDGDLCTDPIDSAPSSGGNYRDRPDFSNGSGGFQGQGSTWNNGDPATQFYVTAGSYTSSSVSSVFSGSNTCYKNTRTLTFPGSKLTFDPNTRYYKGSFIAQMYPGYRETRNHFHLKLSDGDAIVGYDSALSATSFAIARNYPPSSYRTMDFKFASDCTVTTGRTASGYWYDDDNGDPDIQPQPLWVQLRKYDMDGNYLDTVPLTFVGANNVQPAPNNDSYYVYSGSKKTVRMDFHADPNVRYIWRWYHVYYPNGIQLRLPFDSIYYLTGCQLPAGQVQPSSTVDKTKIAYPDTAHFTHYLNVSQFQRQGTVNYSIQRYRNGVAEGGAQNGSYTFNGDGQFTLKNNQFNSTANDAGDRICERLTITDPNPSTQHLDIANNPSEACTVVIARPYLSVTNNDVWAGSRFDYGNTECAGQTARNSSITSWVAGNGGAFGQYGVFARGAISGFGSGGSADGTGLTFANTPSQGQFGAPTRCIPNYYDSLGTSGAAGWPGVGNIPAGSGKKKYISNGDTTFTGGTLKVGNQAVLLVNGNLTIKGNINYATTGFTNQASVPQLWIIVKGNIYIEEGVTNLSGLYVAQGTVANPGQLSTCVQTNTWSPPNPLTTTACNNQLSVYGALIADKILWQRTKGTAAAGQPAAEAIEFDPGLYINSPLTTSTTSGTIKTQDTRELPPIY